MITVHKSYSNVIAILGEEVNGDKTRIPAYNAIAGFFSIEKEATFHMKLASQEETAEMLEILQNLGYMDNLYYLLYLQEVVGIKNGSPVIKGITLIDSTIPGFTKDSTFDKLLNDFNGSITSRKVVMIKNWSKFVLEGLGYIETIFKRKLNIPCLVPPYQKYQLILLEIYKRKS